MRKSILFTVLSLIVACYVSSQPCLQFGIDFTKQSQIDSFQINYPNCTEIIGDVRISGNSINNLGGLNVIQTFWDELTIESNNNLTSLSGLDNLNHVVGDLTIKKNNGLTDLNGLDNLNYIGGNLNIEYGTNLTNISSLNNLTYIGGDLSFEFNYVLASLAGLDNLVYVGGMINLFFNPTLADLSGIDNINAASVSSLSIYNNSSLSDCAVKSICDYLATPTGTIQIYNNAAGCNSEAEIDTLCATLSVENSDLTDLVSIYQTQDGDKIFISIRNGTPVYQVRIFNRLGQMLLYEEKTTEVVDVSELGAGIYIVEVVYFDMVIREKFLIR